MPNNLANIALMELGEHFHLLKALDQGLMPSIYFSESALTFCALVTLFRLSGHFERRYVN